MKMYTMRYKLENKTMLHNNHHTSTYTPATTNRHALSYTHLPLKSSHSPSGIPSSSSISRRQLSASTSAYLTRSCAQSWLHRETWYCELWK